MCDKDTVRIFVCVCVWSPDSRQIRPVTQQCHGDTHPAVGGDEEKRRLNRGAA